MDDRVEEYLDGLLEEDERAEFERHLASDETRMDDLLLARRIRDELRALPLPACPPAVTRAVLAEVRREARADALQRLRRLAPAVLYDGAARWRPVLAMAALAVLVASAAVVGRLPEPRPYPTSATPAEVRQALAEAKWALGYVSELGRATARSVRHDVLETRVVAPMQQALGTIVDEPIKRGTDR